MIKKKLKVLLVIVVLAAFIIPIAKAHKASAATFSILDQAQTFELFDDSSGIVTIQTTLRNDNKNAVIKGYELKIPYKNISGLSAKLNGHSVRISNSYNKKTGLNSISIDFGTRSIKVKSKAALVIQLDVSKLVKKNNNLNYFLVNYLGSSKSTKSAKTTIIFPLNWSNPTFNTLQDFTTDLSSKGEITITTEETKDFFLMWGSKYFVDLESKFSLDKKNAAVNDAIINLPEQSEAQEMHYKEVTNGLTGLYDLIGNNFYIPQFPSENDFNVGFSGRMFKESSPQKLKEITYNWKLSDNYKLSSQSFVSNAGINDAKKKLANFNSLLIDNFSPQTEDAFKLDSINSIQRNIEAGQTTLSSFEYAYLLTAYAESLGLKVNMKYGYVLFPAYDSNSKLPHFWISTEVNGKVLTFDPYLSDITGLNYSGIANELDRISFGTFNPLAEYDSSLGLFSENKLKPKLTMINIGSFLDNSTESVSFVDTKDIVIKSGSFNSFALKVNNPSNRLENIKAIRFADQAILKNTQQNDFLYPALLPLTTSTIKVKGYWELNFLNHGEHNIKLALNLYSSPDKDITGSTFVKFTLIPKYIYAFIAAVNFVFLVIVVIIWRSHLRNRK